MTPREQHDPEREFLAFLKKVVLVGTATLTVAAVLAMFSPWSPWILKGRMDGQARDLKALADRDSINNARQDARQDRFAATVELALTVLVEPDAGERRVALARIRSLRRFAP